MFAFIKKIFFRKSDLLPTESQKTTPVKSTTASSPKSELIPYDTKLVPALEADHQVLLTVYGRIMGHAGKKQYADLTFALNEFSDLLTTHLRKEGSEFYMYLEFVVGKDAESVDRKVFRDFRLEMKDIAVTVMSAINQYTNIPVTDATIDKFTKDFTAIGGVLVDRIEREEKNLYPIYSNYKS